MLKIEYLSSNNYMGNYHCFYYNEMIKSVLPNKILEDIFYAVNKEKKSGH